MANAMQNKQNKKGVRVDAWLWSVRVYKTRNAAKSACIKGNVKINGEPAKPASKLQLNDMVEARTASRTIKYEVKQFLKKRVGAQKVADYVVDHSPPPQENQKYKHTQHEPLPLGAERDRGMGRPTKKERRIIDKLRGHRKH